MAYLQGILAAFGLIREILDGAKSLAILYKNSRDEAWFQESGRVFAKMAEAKSEDERRKVVSDLAKLWGGL
jgi:hypothetical protein